MKNIIIWTFTFILGFFLGAVMAGILEAAWGFAPIEFDSALGLTSICVGMIPAYGAVTWVDRKITEWHQRTEGMEEMEEMIEEIGKNENKKVEEDIFSEK